MKKEGLTESMTKAECQDFKMKRALKKETDELTTFSSTFKPVPIDSDGEDGGRKMVFPFNHFSGFIFVMLSIRRRTTMTTSSTASLRRRRKKRRKMTTAATRVPGLSPKIYRYCRLVHVSNSFVIDLFSIGLSSVHLIVWRMFIARSS